MKHIYISKYSTPGVGIQYDPARGANIRKLEGFDYFDVSLPVVFIEFPVGTYCIGVGLIAEMLGPSIDHLGTAFERIYKFDSDSKPLVMKAVREYRRLRKLVREPLVFK